MKLEEYEYILKENKRRIFILKNYYESANGTDVKKFDNTDTRKLPLHPYLLV